MGGQTRKLKWSLDDLDLSKPIQPLERFIDDPEKLIDEVFKIAAKYLPKDIVPSSLKDIPTVELKKLCLEQLKKVERETLLDILTDGSYDLNEDAECSDINLNETKELDESIPSGSGQSKATTKDVEVQVEIIHSDDRQGKDNDNHSIDVSSKKMKRASAESSSFSGDAEMIEDNDEEGEYDEDTILDQTALEIRELELRAQAIRTLLKKHAESENAAQTESQKESRKRPRTESSTSYSTNAQKQQNSSSNSQKGTEQKVKDQEVKTSKPTCRAPSNPISMVEYESEDVASSSTEVIKGARRKRGDESNIMIQLNNDSDDSIDRELKGE